MSRKTKLFVALVTAAMMLVPTIASAKRTLALQQKRFSGVNWTTANAVTHSTANVLAVRITTTGLNYIEDLVGNILQDKVLTNYVDCMMRQILDANVVERSCGAQGRMGCTALATKTAVECTEGHEYAYWPSGSGAGPYEAKFLFNSCETLGAIAIPMVGTICLAVKLANIDPAGSGDTKIIDFRQIVGGVGVEGTPYLRMRALNKGTPHTEDDTMDILVHLDSIQVDIRVEPPFGLTDTYPLHSDGSAYKNYDASVDYSNYVKAWGRITIPSVEIALSVRTLGRYDDYGVDSLKAPHLRDLGLDLFGLYMDLGLEYVMVPGPYCNNFTDENSLAWDWSLKCGRPCADSTEQNINNCQPTCASCPLPNVEGDPGDTAGETNGCNRANIDATWPSVKPKTNCDDPVLPNSEMIADIIPFLDTHMMMVASNLFTGNQPWPYLDWYIGPTRLLSLNPLMECISIDNPLTIETDLIMINLGFNTEFWADSAGLIIPGDFALDFQYYEDQNGDNRGKLSSNFTSAMTSCVEIRGNSEPVTSMAKAACAPSTACDDFINYGREIIGVGACSSGDTNCPMMGVCPGTLGQFCNGSPASADYHIGIGVHQNLISTVIYDAITTGLLCLWLDKEVIKRDLEKVSGSGVDITSMMGSVGGGSLSIDSILGQVFKTDIFALMVPDLSLYWPSADMAIEVIPAVTYPRAKANGQKGPAPLAGYAEPITNEPPYAKVGKLELDYQYVVPGQVMGSEITYMGAPTLTTNDLTIVIPHLNLNFYIYDKSTTTQLYTFTSDYGNKTGLNPYDGKRYSGTPLGKPMRAFGLDLGATIGIDLNLLNLGTTEYVFDFYTGGTGTPSTFPRRPLPGGDMVPGYHKGTGADGDAGFNAGTRKYRFPVYTYPGSIEMRTGRVIDVGAIIDPDIRYYLEYYEAIPDWNSASTKYADFYEDVLGNLLPTLLSGLTSVDLSLGLDIGRILNTPFTIDPTSAPLKYGLDKGAGIFPAGPNTDKLATTPIWPAGNLGLNDPDWLGTFISLNGKLSAKALLAIAAPLLSGLTTGGGTSSLTSMFSLGSSGTTMSVMNLNVGDVLGALGASLGGIGSLIGLGTRPACSAFDDVPATNIDNPPYSYSPCSPFSPAYWEIMSNYYPPETTINQPSAVDARGTLISFDATDDKDSDGKIGFSYRLDHGFWSPWSAQRYAVLKGLLEGKHLFEVRSVDTDNNIEPTPAQMVFQVDSIPPTISLSGSVHGSSATFVADVRDFQTKPEEVQIAYRLDEGSWSDYSASKKIELAYLSDGTHTLSVKAMDKSGNEGIATQAFNVTPETTFGCSTVPTSGSALFLLLLVPGFLVLRRRISR